MKISKLAIILTAAGLGLTLVYSQQSASDTPTKAQQILRQKLTDMKAGENKSTSMTNHDVRVRIIGDVAIVQGMDDEKSTSKGKDVSGTYIWTDVFQKRSGHWVAVASQGSPVKPEK